MKESGCENCFLKKRAERKPKSIISKLWKWHTKWCPGWKAYQKNINANSDANSKKTT